VGQKIKTPGDARLRSLAEGDPVVGEILAGKRPHSKWTAIAVARVALADELDDIFKHLPQKPGDDPRLQERREKLRELGAEARTVASDYLAQRRREGEADPRAALSAAILAGDRQAIARAEDRLLVVSRAGVQALVRLRGLADAIAQLEREQETAWSEVAGPLSLQWHIRAASLRRKLDEAQGAVVVLTDALARFEAEAAGAFAKPAAAAIGAATGSWRALLHELERANRSERGAA
jgi:hypothetical protein